MDTSTFRIASVIGAGVSIVAGEDIPIALALKALVIGGAQGVIVAKFQIREEGASPFGRAPIVGAGIVVDAFFFGSCRTDSGFAQVALCAVISVFTQGPVGHVDEEAISGFLFASRRSRARVLVVLAGLGCASAHAFFADISGRTGIPIGAGGPVGEGFEETSFCRVTQIVRADFPVVADDVLPPNALFFRGAGIPGGAGVAIIAVSTGDNGVHTFPGGLIATVVRAGMVVVADLTRAEVQGPFSGRFTAARIWTRNGVCSRCFPARDGTAEVVSLQAPGRATIPRKNVKRSPHCGASRPKVVVIDGA